MIHTRQIQGNTVVLQPTQIEQRAMIFQWFAQSDITKYIFGPPTFPEFPVPTWDEFCEDFQDFYFDDLDQMKGRSYLIEVQSEYVGQINYNLIERAGATISTELDIWLRAEKDCGKGFGVDAILALCEHLYTTLGVNEFWVQPSERNPRSIASYQKAGFVRQTLTVEEIEKEWEEPDYFDSVFMRKRM